MCNVKIPFCSLTKEKKAGENAAKNISIYYIYINFLNENSIVCLNGTTFIFIKYQKNRIY